MTGLYIFAGLIVVSTVILFVIRGRWAKADKIEEQMRESRLEKDRVDEAAKEAARVAVKGS
jgi:hypothetical protein